MPTSPYARHGTAASEVHVGSYGLLVACRVGKDRNLSNPGHLSKPPVNRFQLPAIVAIMQGTIGGQRTIQGICGCPPLVRTHLSALTTFPICYAICMDSEAAATSAPPLGAPMHPSTLLSMLSLLTSLSTTAWTGVTTGLAGDATAGSSTSPALL